MSELDARKSLLLRAVILEYVSNAEPVGSELLAQKYEFGVRSATVRNELADMAERGYLEQPHTSAGRIPSDQGYRYYVDHLVIQRPLDAAEKGAVRQATQEGDVLQSLLQDTARSLSRITQLMSAAASVQATSTRIEHALVTALNAERALLVVVMNTGHVENRIIDCPKGLSLDDLGWANEQLVGLVANKAPHTVGKLKVQAGSSPRERVLFNAVTNLRQIGKELTKRHLVVEGEEFIIAQPEFQHDAKPVLELLKALKEDPDIGETAGTSGEVTIGTEHGKDLLKPFTLIRQNFYVGQDAAGVLALIGPTRMNYDSSIAILDFTARAVSAALSKSLGR